MNDQIRHISVVGRPGQFGEPLSALMDGELAHDQVRFLLRGVEIESDLAQRWSSYHVIRATLRHEVTALPLRADFAAGILDRLDHEVAATTKVATRRHGALRWVGGGAIAAAVAVVALVSGPVEQRGARGGTSPSDSALAQQGAPAGGARQAYLPLLQQAGATGKGFMPASEETLLQYGYAPDGSVLQQNYRDYFSQGAEPYTLYVDPQTHRVAAPFPMQNGAPQR